MTDRELMQQALNALEKIARYGDLMPELKQPADAAIKALRERLAQEPQTTHSNDCWRWHHKCAVAKIEKECKFGVAGRATSPWRESAAQGCSPGGTGMPATPPQRPAEPVQEPVAWMCSDVDLVRRGYSRFSERCEGAWNIPVYTAPQPAQQPLTDEQIRDLWSWSMTAGAERTANTQQHAFARAVEAAHGITGEKQ